MSDWSAADIGDQTGRHFVVTGANSGLGKETALALGRAGATVTLACRDVLKAQPVAAEMGDRASVRHLDLADLRSVREFAGAVGDIDVLINNAGVMGTPLRRTADGFEMQFGTNHLGHFALTGLLLDRISERVVTMSSFMHHLGQVDLADPNYERRRYERWTAYGQSKLANLQFALELARRLSAAGSSVSSAAAHPGYAATGLQSHTESFMDAVMGLGNRLLAQPAAEGALPELYAATSADAASGGFYGPKQLFGMRGRPGKSRMSGAARNTEAAAGLWQLSEDLTGVTFPL
ncbi:oxidoreductase [Tsukamurella sp. 8F]|uniref:oxidoreductase n=1 Tax=unclassified Tsukamurella TaxID=2633480 RepID=UPI0023B953C3|nr:MULTISPECIES: oxidoreductase [unclassified Tsukamurella]MDF0528494.1 oxidoreductase [Tsukamurella sp. 8J]MDF0586320.1 oxidoreductase [Tsukamurella sp. 8F]